MEPESPLPSLQEFTADPHPETDTSSPHISTHKWCIFLSLSR